MPLEYFSWVIFYMVVFFLSFSLLVYLAVKAKKSPLLYSFLFMHFITLLWILRATILFVIISYIKDENQLTSAFELLNWKFGTAIGGLAGLSWLIFSLNYADWKHAGNKLAIVLLSAPTVFFILTALTNDVHRLFMYKFVPGIFFWFHAFIGYLYSITGFIILIRYSIRKMGYERTRTILLMAAYFLAFTSSLINELLVEVLHSKPILGYADSSPIAFTVANALIALLIYKYRFLNIKTIALNKIVNNLKQSVVIVDSFNKIISLNRSFSEAFPDGIQSKEDQRVLHLNEHLKERIDPNEEGQKILEAINSNQCINFQGVLKLAKPHRKYYDVVIYPILDNERALGRIISFDDITRVTEFMEELEEKNDALSLLNDELIDKNRQLRDYAAAAEELAVMRERSRFSRDVHDTLGHTMTVLITQLQVVDILSDTEPDKAKLKIKEIMEIAKNGLNELRKSISGLMPGKSQNINLEDALIKLVADFEASGMKIDLSLNGDSNCLTSEYFEVLFRLCQEALTNALRHGKAKHVDIVFNFLDEKCRVFIKDDGRGCKEVHKGFGIKGMEERVSSLGGNIQYGSDGENGFNIFVELPTTGSKELLSRTGG
ncbi:MAG: histidine kinase [Clostridia bacterium]|nr:histidine kinase [Clostridia bacterium]